MSGGNGNPGGADTVAISPDAGLDATTGVPIVFQAPAGRCFGWFHAAQLPTRSMGVVLCRPMGYEALCSYRSYSLLAQTLARSGFDVLRFDYHGTGDSAGADTDGDRVPDWLASIEAAAGEVKRLAGVSRIALAGVRLGATLAARAAARMGGVDSLVLWAPCVTGRAFAREMRAAAANRSTAPGEAAPQLEALGCLYTAQTLASLQALDCTRVERAPARHALIIARDDMPAEGPLPAAYRRLGMEVSYVEWPGYAAMMAEPLDTVLEAATFDRIAAWLSAHAAEAPRAAQPRCVPDWPGDWKLDGVRESAHRFGSDRSLFGIVSEPAEGRCDTAVLMLNVGGNYRIGPHRLYVRAARALAAAGCCALRFDLEGIGDSRTQDGACLDSMYFRHAAPDVSAAIDFLAARGCRRFYLLGICSGAYVAFQSALLDARVTGQVLMNPRLLEWHAAPRDNWQASMRRHYKSIAYYRRALLQSSLYQRLLRGEVDVRGVARRVATLAAARLARVAGALWRGGTAQDGVLPGFRRLGARGCDTLMIMSAHDDALDYVELHLGRRGNRLKDDPNFRLVTLEHSDHTFSTHESQRVVIETVKDFLERRQAPAREWPAVPGRVAAT